MLLQYTHIFFLPHDAIYFVKGTGPSCSKAPPQHDAVTSPCITVGMVFFDLQASPFFLQTKRWSLWPNSSIFVSSDQRTFHQKSMIFVPMCSCKVERPFSLCRYRTRFTVDVDTFLPVSSSIFTRSFAVLGLICTFRNKVP